MVSKAQYDKFDQINGQHPWQTEVPEGYINYNVRQLPKGKVAYFNFNLAKEMGLIPKNHKHKLNNILEQKILETFNLRIINEYDLTNNKSYPQEKIKPFPYMATRYLQLQHDSKVGNTSGDGRGLWNGCIVSKGQIWDISSRGTGVTSLSPGAAKAGVPLETGNIDHGYGCGLAEIDELYSSTLMSEVLHNNGYKTERMLAIVEHKGGFGIGVRAGNNLFRPAHLFTQLKQSNYSALKAATDFVLNRQVLNKEWDIDLNSKYKYDKMLDAVVNDFAEFTAYLERDYIFAWLDWDGDNVLANGGIIDYGSIRQFGVRHDQYRYDDVERYSTTLNEQRRKARLIIQVYCQLTDYLKTSEKKSLHSFKDHPALNKFDQAFKYYLHDRFLLQLGLNKEVRSHLLMRNKKFIHNLYEGFIKLETLKTKNKKYYVEDGINRPPVLNMRKFSIELATHLLDEKKQRTFDPAELFRHSLVNDHFEEDAEVKKSTLNKIESYCEDYLKLISKVERFYGKKNIPQRIQNLVKTTELINSPKRVTGNALVFIVGEILKKKKSGFQQEDIQALMDKFTSEQSFNPEVNLKTNESKLTQDKTKALMRTVLSILEEHSEDI